MMTKEEKEWYDNIHKTIMKKKSYDGMTFKELKNGIIQVEINIKEALNQEKERNIFLNGQLLIEDLCDRLISNFFTPRWKFPTESYCLNGFLSSRNITFSHKIDLLRLMLPPSLRINSKTSKDYDYYPINKKIIQSLTSIALIRNYFHHKLSYYDALWHITKAGKGGAKFALIGKKLNSFKQFNEFINAYKEEVIKLYSELEKIIDYQERNILKNNKNG